MKCRLLWAAQVTVLAASMPGFAQEVNPEEIEPSQLKVISGHEARQALGHVTASFGTHSEAAATNSINAATSGLQVWTYTAKANQNGSSYTGLIVGSNPGASTQTAITTYLIPVIINITQGGRTYTFDPTQTDPGCLGSNTGFGLTQQSPLLNNATYKFGTNQIANMQYADAILHGEFASFATSSYHVTLNATTLPALTININASRYGNSTAAVFGLSGTQCGYNTSINPAAKLGVVNINTMDSLLQQYITAHGITADQFPFFVTYNAVMSNGSANNTNNCCILGYHNALGSPGQTYGIGEFEGRNQTVFSGAADVAALSHEINEWTNDPSGSNPTPAWGYIGQVSGCQTNLEVGDPLSGTLMPTVTMPNNFTYHLQELAFFSWFYGTQSYGSGIGGMYSSNGTFKGMAKLCPPGGTN